jgi:hypothetical protein
MSPIAFPPTPYYRAPLLNGDAGVEQTINQMRGLVDAALHDPSIIRLATDIVRSVPAFDDYSEANALYNWVRQNIRFTKDPVGKEKLYPPTELLKIRAGDCDDISMLLGTLLMAVGYPARLMTVAAAGSDDQFSHVYVEGNVGGNWVAMDPARSDSQFGVAPTAFTRARWWSLTDNSQGDLSGARRAKFWSTAGDHMHGLGNYPRFRSHVSGMGSYYQPRTMGFLGTPPDPSSVQDLVNAGYNATTINALISMGATNEQLQALPFPASATEMQAGVNALSAQLGGGVVPPPMAVAPAATPSGAQTTASIATIYQGTADIIRAASGQPASPFDFAASGPYQSFQTQYSPYGVSAGYPAAVAPGISLTSSSNIGLWLALGLGAVLFFGMRK